MLLVLLDRFIVIRIAKNKEIIVPNISKNINTKYNTSPVIIVIPTFMF